MRRRLSQLATGPMLNVGSSYTVFARMWGQVHGEADAEKSLPLAIAQRLQTQRIAHGGRKVAHEAKVTGLPSGVMVAHGALPVLTQEGRRRHWRPDGYAARHNPVWGLVPLLRCVVYRCMRRFQPIDWRCSCH